MRLGLIVLTFSCSVWTTQSDVGQKGLQQMLVVRYINETSCKITKHTERNQSRKICNVY